jgi:hypothetical protein
MARELLPAYVREKDDGKIGGSQPGNKWAAVTRLSCLLPVDGFVSRARFVALPCSPRRNQLR